MCSLSFNKDFGGIIPRLSMASSSWDGTAIIWETTKLNFHLADNTNGLPICGMSKSSMRAHFITCCADKSITV